MKKAVIVVGSHLVGKSKTIREHVKPKLGIGKEAHIFTRNGQSGFVLSQSFEEANRDVEDSVSRYSHYELLILSARPAVEHPSCLNELKAELKIKGYEVSTVDVSAHLEDSYYEAKADEIMSQLDASSQVSLKYSANQ